jgi:lysophospholipase L1-like esterase
MTTVKALAYPFGKVYNFVFEGDSETAGNGLTLQQTWPLLISATNGAAKNNGARWANMAASGNTIVTILTQTETVDALYDATYSANWAVLLAGTNDIGGDDDAATIYANLETWVTGRKAVGFSVAILTLPPVTEAVKTNAVNALIRAGLAGADALVDIAADARLQDPADGVNYQADHIHFSAAGAVIVGELVRAALPK